MGGFLEISYGGHKDDPTPRQPGNAPESLSLSPFSLSFSLPPARWCFSWRRKEGNIDSQKTGDGSGDLWTSAPLNQTSESLLSLSRVPSADHYPFLAIFHYEFQAKYDIFFENIKFNLNWVKLF